MAVRGINYEEGNPETYESVDFRYTENGKRVTKKFNSGDFVNDWMHALKWFIEGDLGEHLCNSSSVDHFIMDGAPYDSAYIGFDAGEKAFLYYLYDDGGLEVFVPKGTKPTWEELLKMCKDDNSN